MENLHTPRNIIIYAAIANQGDWNGTSQALKAPRPNASDSDMEAASKTDAITPFDDEYPRVLMNAPQGPLVLFKVETPESEELRLSKDFKADAWIQGKHGFWTDDEKEAHKATMERFAEMATVTVTDKAEIKISQGTKSITLREYCGRNVRQSDFAPAYRIASALSNNLFLFNAKPKCSGILMAAMHMSFGDNKDIYVLPHPFTSDDLCNEFLAYSTPITRQTLAEFKGIEK